MKDKKISLTKHVNQVVLNYCHILVCVQVVVLWVGTNNHGQTAEQICGGIMAIVQVIKNKLRHAHTLVLVGVSDVVCSLFLL